MKRSELKRGTTPMKRSELKRGDSQLKRSKMTTKKSKAQSSYDAEFERMKQIVRVRSKGFCESWRFVILKCSTEVQYIHLASPMARDCQFRNPVHVHHRKYRKRGGSNSLDNLIHLCEPCHSFVHAHGGFGREANVMRLALSADESETL